MRLRARCTMEVETPCDCPVVATLRPRSGRAQWMVSEHYELRPWVPSTEYVDHFGNLGQRFVIPAGKMTIDVEVLMETEEFLAVAPAAPRTPIKELPDETLVYLLQSRYCPCDRLQKEAAALVEGVAPGYAQVEAIRAWIHQEFEYRYGTSDASTDALETMARREGVCRDFAHVGIALTRALHIPARLVVGYLWQLDPMDMHAWFEAFVDGRWYTFDATQAQPRGGRIVLAYGRDATDVAFLSNYGELSMGKMAVTVERMSDAVGGP